MAETIRLRADDGHEFDAYHVHAEGQRKGYLVLVMEIFGVNGHIRELAHDFARHCYEVLAPAMYDRAERGVDLGYTPETIVQGRALRDRIGWDVPMKDVAAAVAWLAPHGKVGIVGYCFGGSIAWLSACRVPGLAAAVGYYGTAVVQFMGETPRCPTMLHFGDKDASIPVVEVEKLKAIHPEVEVHRYDADHGFRSDRRANYDETASRLADGRTLAFFARHLA
jgi:carboxymethylenebutenolidase